MRGVNGKSVLAGAVIGILAVGVAFAAFASTLTINGTAELSGDFNVKFTAASPNDTKATTTLSTIDASNGTLSFDINTILEEPGSQSVVSYTISNLGTIGADLSTPSLTCYSDSAKTDEIPCSDADVTINAGVVNPTILAAAGTATGTVTVKWEATSETVPENNMRYFTVTINANQAE